MEVFDIISHIIRNKRDNRVVPDHALRREILDFYCGGLADLDGCLSDLKAAGRVKECRVLNDVAFVIVEFDL